jgi:small-conductance mechanosensitive channel
MLFAIISAWLAYKRAKDTGRNAILWAFIAAAVFIGTQILVSGGIGVFMGFGVALWGWSETVFEDYQILISIVAIVCSFISTGLILRYLNSVPEDATIYEAPPPPPKF